MHHRYTESVSRKVIYMFCGALLSQYLHSCMHCVFTIFNQLIYCEYQFYIRMPIFIALCVHYYIHS